MRNLYRVGLGLVLALSVLALLLRTDFQTDAGPPKTTLPSPVRPSPTATASPENATLSWSPDNRVELDHIDYDSDHEEYLELLEPHTDPDQQGAREAERFLVRGTAYLKRNQFDRALLDYQRALRLAPRDARVHHRLAQYYVSRNRFTDALTSADIALKLEPRLHTTYGLRSWCHTRLGNLIEADRDWATFASLVPASAGDFAQLASERLRRGELELSLASAREGQTLNATSPNAGIVGVILKKQGKDQEALDALELAIKGSPCTITWRIHQAALQQKLGIDNGEALAEVQRLQTEELR